MKTSWFTFPVEIEAIDWPWKSDFPPEDVVPLLNDFFKYPATFDLQYEFHEVTRPDFGLVRSIKVITPNFSENRQKADYYAIRIYQKSVLEDSAIDLAKYHQNRIKKLMDALNSFYPRTYFLESTKFVVVLQPFLFSPVCDFTQSTDVLNLFKLIYLSSKARILLDYNHNHFLRVIEGKKLFYVDSDYMGDKYPDIQSALKANLNQAMIFITYKNAKYIANVLLSLSNQSESLLEFTKSVVQALNNFVLLCRNDWENTSPSLRAKIESLEIALQSIDIH